MTAHASATVTPTPAGRPSAAWTPSRRLLAALGVAATLAGCGGAVSGGAAPATVDMPDRLDGPHRPFGLTSAAVDVARFEAVQAPARRLLAVIPAEAAAAPAADAGAPATVPSGKDAGAPRDLSTVTKLAAIAPNLYTVAGDRLAAAGTDETRRIGVFAWRFDDWTDQLAEFQAADGGFDAWSLRSRAKARAVGSAASDGPAGEVRFDVTRGPVWGQLGGYPQAWMAMVYAVGAGGRVRAAGPAEDVDPAVAPAAGTLVASATFDRPFRTVLWGGQGTEGPYAGRPAPLGRYALVLRPIGSSLVAPPRLLPAATLAKP